MSDKSQTQAQAAGSSDPVKKPSRGSQAGKSEVPANPEPEGSMKKDFDQDRAVVMSVNGVGMFEASDVKMEDHGVYVTRADTNDRVFYPWAGVSSITQRIEQG